MSWENYAAFGAVRIRLRLAYTIPPFLTQSPIEYQRIRNETGVIIVMVYKPPYSFKRLVYVYKVRLNVYKIKRQAHP